MHSAHFMQQASPKSMENPYQVPGHDGTAGARSARGKVHAALSLIIATLCILQFLGVCLVARHAVVEYGLPPGAVAHKLVLPLLLALGGVFLVFGRRLAAIFFAAYLVMYLVEFQATNSINLSTVVMALVFLAYGLWLWKSGLLAGWPNIPVRDATDVEGAALTASAQNFGTTRENHQHASAALSAASSSQRWMAIATLLIACPQVLLTALLAPTLFGHFRDGNIGALAYLSWISPSTMLFFGARLLLHSRRTALYLFVGAVLLAAFAHLQWRSQLEILSLRVFPGLFIAGCAGVVGAIASYGSTKT